MVAITLTFLWTKVCSQRQRNKAFYCNNTLTGVRFIDQQIHTQQPSRCNMCRCGALLNKYLRRGDVADATADGGTVFFVKAHNCVCFHSKGLKTDKLPSHLFEIDEDAKDEVRRHTANWLWPDGSHWLSPEKHAIIDTKEHCRQCGQRIVSGVSLMWSAYCVNPKTRTSSPCTGYK